MKEFLTRIGITDPGSFDKDGNYVIDFDTSREFNNVFAKLDKSDEVEENENASNITLEMSSIQYMSDNYILNLTADFSQDIYKLVLTER